MRLSSSMDVVMVIATYCIATTPHDWHIIVHSRSSKVNDFNVIWKPVFDLLLVINSNLGPILHRLATIHPLQRTTNDDGQQPWKTPTALLYRVNNICQRQADERARSVMQPVRTVV